MANPLWAPLWLSLCPLSNPHWTLARAFTKSGRSGLRVASAHVLPSDVQIQKPPKLKYQQNQQKVIENQQKVIENQQKYDKTQQDVVENSKCNLKIKTRRTDGVERLFGIH